MSRQFPRRSNYGLSNGTGAIGLELKRKPRDVAPSVVNPENSDGATEVYSQGAAYYGYYFNTDLRTSDDVSLIHTYRALITVPEVDLAITEITNEAIINDDEKYPVALNLDLVKDNEVPKKIKEKILEEFGTILKLYDFSNKGHDIFRVWYVDGRIYYEMLPHKDTKQGLAELKFIDSTQIRLVREVKKKIENNIEYTESYEEYYSYNPNGVNRTTTTTNGTVRLTKDSIVYVNSGLLDGDKHIISYLHKAVKPSNQLKFLEDAVVIYRITRAPDRRIFYIDVGNLPKHKAEQHIKDIMNKYRNKLVYDANTGEIKDDRRFLTMQEDFWMPRKDGGKGTEIDTLPAGQQLGEIGDIEYFQNKLAHSLNIPFSRFKNDSSFSLGKSNEITRDEIRFSKFVAKLRSKFSNLFLIPLKTQLILKGILSEEQWDSIKENIRIIYHEDNYFSELKEQEILGYRVSLAQQMDVFVGKYYSVEYIQKKVLKLTDDEVSTIKQQNEITKKQNPEWLGQYGQPFLNNMNKQPQENQDDIEDENVQ